MNAKVDVEVSKMDNAKLAGSALLLVAGIYAFYYFNAYSALLRVSGLLALGFIAVALVYQTAVGQRIWQFSPDSRMEVRKVVWPTRQETLQTTLVVFIMVLIMGILLWLFDMLLVTIVKYLIGQGG
jgi:preprotein translocase subunit SecE